ncbi:lantibiotic dehydratase family protein [Streptomyces sp. NPDC058690]|uniref:lantibiotic dehydratase family protein n=1 Tax=Streptomyces sp. NPDC058690 TaxID=3346600 RepID=UPI00365F27E1
MPQPSPLTYTTAGPVLIRIPLAPISDATGNRAAPNEPAAAPPTPAQLRERITALLGDDLLMEAVALASPSTAQTCRQPLHSLSPKKLRTLAGSLTGYASRMQARATPFGLFAGVTLANPAATGRGHVAAPARHHRVARPDAGWLQTVIHSIERSDAALSALEYIANPAVRRDTDMLVLLTPDADTRRIRLRASAALHAALDAAAQQEPGRRILQAVAEHCETQDDALPLVRTLVVHGYLVSELQPPPHDGDPLDHVLRCLRLRQLRPDIATVLEEFGTATAAYAAEPLGQAGTALDRVHEVADRATTMSGASAASAGSPLQVDTVVQADIALSPKVLAEAQEAASVLARFAIGRDRYHLQRYLQQTSDGYSVPLTEVACPPLPAQERTSPPALLAAYAAALHEDRTEIELDDALLDAIAPAEQGAPVSELDLFAVVSAPDVAALDRGDFALHLRRPASSSSGTALARFAPALGATGVQALRAINDQADRAAVSTHSPTALTADVTFRPRQHAAQNVARSTLTRGIRISTNGPAGKPEAGAVLTPQDLLLSAGPHGPQIWSRKLGVQIVPRAVTALNSEATGPHSAHVLAAATSQNTAVGFDWGALARAPWLPRIRRGRTVYSPQTWQPGDDLLYAGAQGTAWHAHFARWCKQWSVPEHVTLVDGDRQIPLHLSDPVDLSMLRRQAHKGPVVLTETLSSEHCWARSSLGAHLVEAVFSLVVVGQQPGSAEPAAPPPERPLPVSRALPGGDWLRARLRCPPARQPRLRHDLNRTLAQHRWFLTRPDPEFLEIHVHRGTSPSPSWDDLVSQLSRTLTGVGGHHHNDALTILTYPRDAGFGTPVRHPDIAERWAMADTRCALAVLHTSFPDTLLLSTLNLARHLARIGKCTPLSGIEPDREQFAPLRRRVLPLITQDGHLVPPAEMAGGLLQLWEQRAAATQEYLHALNTPAEIAHAGSLLLEQHTQRLAGRHGSPALMALAAAAERAASAWHRATRNIA